MSANPKLKLPINLI